MPKLSIHSFICNSNNEFNSSAQSSICWSFSANCKWHEHAQQSMFVSYSLSLDVWSTRVEGLQGFSPLRLFENTILSLICSRKWRALVQQDAHCILAQKHTAKVSTVNCQPINSVCLLLFTSVCATIMHQLISAQYQLVLKILTVHRP